jgi:ketosteroid isomerase-like protein
VHTFSTLRAILLAGALASVPPFASAQAHSGHHATPADSAEVAATVDRFHRAMAAADSAGALALLTKDVQILESGGTEDRPEYRSHHLASDVEFARAVPSRRGATAIRIHGDVAWVTSTPRRVPSAAGRSTRRRPS